MHRSSIFSAEQQVNAVVLILCVPGKTPDVFRSLCRLASGSSISGSTRPRTSPNVLLLRDYPCILIVESDIQGNERSGGKSGLATQAGFSVAEWLAEENPYVRAQTGALIT